MSNELKEIQEQLHLHAQKSNKDFLYKMVPGEHRSYGVKTPVLNELAKQYRKASFELARELWISGALEERIIAIKIMEKEGKNNPAMLFNLFTQFSKGIDNWAVCDGLGMQFLRSVVKTHQEEIFGLAEKLNKSDNFWERRLSLVMVEWYTRISELHPRIDQLAKNLEQDKEYYVKKAVVWIRKNFAKGK